MQPDNQFMQAQSSIESTPKNKWKITTIALLIISLLLAGLSGFLVIEKFNGKDDQKTGDNDNKNTNDENNDEKTNNTTTPDTTAPNIPKQAIYIADGYLYVHPVGQKFKLSDKYKLYSYRVIQSGALYLTIDGTLYNCSLGSIDLKEGKYSGPQSLCIDYANWSSSDGILDKLEKEEQQKELDAVKVIEQILTNPEKI